MDSAAAQLSHLVPENGVRVLGHATHQHDLPHLIHAVVGTAHLVVDGEPITLHAKASLWLAAGVPHSARPTAGSLLMGPMLHPGATPQARVERLGAVPALAELMVTALAIAPTSREQVDQVRTAIGEVLTTLRRPHFRVLVPTHPVAAAIARDAGYSAEPLEVLCARHTTSVRHIQRVFREETGLPFHRWRVRLRLNAAISRLRTGDSLERAARHAGYATRSGLVKALHREVNAADLNQLLGR